MSEDMKKSLRTQGRFTDKGIKHRDKRQKESPVDKEPPGKKSYSQQKRDSTGPQNESSSFTDVSENDSPVKYEENSSYSFNELDDAKKPVEIKSGGEYTLSETFHGVSTILYEPFFIEEYEGDELFDRLRDCTNWNTKNIVIRGQEFPQPRLVAWYGPFPYTYSGVTLEPATMPDAVLTVKEKIEDFLRLKDINVTLNSVLLNFYRNGYDSVAWHSDDELTMGICPTIASVSLGAPRKFEMKRKVVSYENEEDINEYFVNLTHGSLLIMNGSMQDDWLHRVPKEYHDKPPRINLTFRTVYSLDKSPRNSAKEHRITAAKKNALDRSSDSQISFKDSDFPPLAGTVHTFSSEEENLHEVSQDSNLSVSVSEYSDKSMDNNNSKSFPSPLENDLNDGKKYFKQDMQNKNIHSYDSYGAVSDSSGRLSFDSNKFIQDDPMNVSIDSSVDVLPDNTYVHDIHVSTSVLNADAAEFVPISPVPAPGTDFNHFDLEQFVEYNHHDRGNNELDKFALALKVNLTDNMDKFNHFEKEELYFSFDLMKDPLSERTLRKVTDRMCHILQKALSKKFYHNNHNSSYNSRPRSSVPRQEHHDSQQDFRHSSGGKRYSNKGERRTSQEDQCFNRRERLHNKEDEYSSRRNRQYNNMGEKRTDRDEGRTSRGDGSVSQGRRNIRQ